MKKNISLFILYVFIFCFSSYAQAHITSSCAEEISQEIAQLINDANNRQINISLSLLNTEVDLSMLGKKISSANTKNKSFQTKAAQLLISDKNENKIGTISFRLGKGIVHSLKGRQDSPSNGKINEEQDYFAVLEKITIYTQFQNQGYSSKALHSFHYFLDKLGVTYTVLEVFSKKVYAAKIYDKQGYCFTVDRLSAIEQTVGYVNAFLQDSTQILHRNSKQITVLMVRWKVMNVSQITS